MARNCVKKEHDNDIHQYDKNLRYVLFFVLLALLTRGAWLLLTDNVFNAGDNFDRVVDAYKLFQNPKLVPSVNWVFGHFWMLFIPMWIFDDFNVAPRLLGLVSGSLLPIPIFYLGKRLFGHVSATVSCLLYAFALPQIILSGSTLTAIPFSFFIFMGISFFIRYQDKKTLKNILGAALFFMLANSLRLEAWLYAFAAGVFLLWKRRGVNKHILIYLFITIIPISIFMWDNYIKTGDLLFALARSDFHVKIEYGVRPLDLLSRVTPTLFSFSGASFVLGIAGGILSLARKKNIFIIGLFSLAYFFPVYKILTGSLMGDFRYFTAQSIFAYLLTGYFVKFVIKMVNRKELRKKIFILISSILVASLGEDYISYPDISKDIPLTFSKNHWALVNKIGEIKKSKELNVYLDDGVMFQAFRYQARLYDMGNVLCEAWHPDWDAKPKKSIEECFINHNINAIITIPGGQLHNYIQRNKYLITKYFKIDQKYTFGEYCIYIVERRGTINR